MARSVQSLRIAVVAMVVAALVALPVPAAISSVVAGQNGASDATFAKDGVLVRTIGVVTGFLPEGGGRTTLAVPDRGLDAAHASAGAALVHLPGADYRTAVRIARSGSHVSVPGDAAARPYNAQAPPPAIR